MSERLSIILIADTEESVIFKLQEIPAGEVELSLIKEFRMGKEIVRSCRIYTKDYFPQKSFKLMELSEQAYCGFL